jgi:molybdate transport system regulatory protein
MLDHAHATALNPKEKPMDRETDATAQALTGKIELDTPLGLHLGGTRIRLLEEIGRCGSISQAAKKVPLSYKAAWDAVDAMNNLADQPLVERSAGGKHGGGTTLTDFGRRMVALYRAVEAEQQRALDALARGLAGMPEGDLADVRRLQTLMRRMAVKTSARNQFVGTVSALRYGEVDFEVTLRIDESTEIVAIITGESATALGVAIGREVQALVKSSSVLLMNDRSVRTTARNQLWGTVDKIIESPVNAQVTLALQGGRTVSAVVTHESIGALGLAVGQPACAMFKASSVILATFD